MLRVLIVEDESIIALVASIALEAAGYHVTEPIDGQEGLQIASQERPELIITDYMMPRMDGVEMIRRLRAAGFEQPIILATSVPESMLPETRYDAYLAKPYREQDLLAVVRRFAASPED